MLSLNSKLMARFMTGKGLVVHGRLRRGKTAPRDREQCAGQRAHAANPCLQDKSKLVFIIAKVSGYSGGNSVSSQMLLVGISHL